MRKKLIALISAGLLLVGCSAQSADDAFISDLNERIPDFISDGARPLAIDLAHKLCDTMSSGDSGWDSADIMMETGFSLAESGAFVVAAVDNYCPEHADLVR